MLLGLLAADELQDVIGGRDHRDVHEFHVKLQAEGSRDLRPFDLTGLDQFGDGQGVRILTVWDGLDVGAGRGHVGRRHQSLVLYELDDVVVGGRHSREIRSGR